MVLIQKATEFDIESLRLAAISAFLHDERYKPENAKPGGPPGHDTIESHANWIKNYDYLKCVVQGEIAGGCIVKKHPNHYELFGIFLHRNYIGKGIGSEFLHGVMNMYPAGIVWFLETPDYTTRNHSFYERNGFNLRYRTKTDSSLGYGFMVYKYIAQPSI